jgi:hypothetical protein
MISKSQERYLTYIYRLLEKQKVQEWLLNKENLINQESQIINDNEKVITNE